MAMLAEKKSKRKWCLNPNGKDWSDDNNKFGQKMLEKMGWKKGCGLGINLQGQKEHVKVSVKNDSKGLGCDANPDLEWLNHQDNYNSLLSELSSAIGDGVLTVLDSSSGKSLEDKSKTSRARVHYKKFVRGKDVSRYSGTDLMCILGKAEGITQKGPVDNIENEVPESNPEINQKKKKRAKSDNRCDEELLEEFSNDRKSSSEVMVCSGRDGKTESVTEETRFDETEVPETNCKTSMKKKKKRKNSSEEGESVRDKDVSTDMACILGNAESVIQRKRLIDKVENEVPETIPEINQKKKKKAKSDDGCDEELLQEFSNDTKSSIEVMVCSGRDGKTESVTEETKLDETEVPETNWKTSMKKKKKRKYSSEEGGSVRDKDVSTDLACILGNAESVIQRKRLIDEVENEVPETIPEINQKKKKKAKSDDGCDEELLQEFSNDTKSSIEVMVCSSRDGKTESVTEETKLDETEVPETNWKTSMKKKKKRKNSSEERESVRDKNVSTDLACILGNAESVIQRKRPIDEVENEVPETNPKINLKKKKKKKGKCDDRCDEELIEESSNDREPRNKETRLADLVENEIPETNCTSIKRKKKKNSSEDSMNFPDGDVEASPGITKSKRKKCDETIELSSKDSAVSVFNETQETNGITEIKNKKSRLQESEDGRVEEFASPEDMKSKLETSNETVYVLSKKAAEILERKFKGFEISTSDSFNGSNLHVVKGYKYDRR